MQTLERFTFGTRGRKRIGYYDWKTWCDGRIRQVDPLKEWNVSPKNFRDAIHNHVRRLREQGKVVLVDTSTIDGVVVFRILIDGC